ncbi:hypothetical protein C466_00707 [Halorubrum distributum JCM 10118]|uniref:Uncharacterized protein n=1 Tax=Halorubrum distributum JCM 10118 TaxID=1227468 RepID=M0FE60_9EURY|nr:hypothetical protein C466_00707 [Halorubrum distributum JCM 10118]
MYISRVSASALTAIVATGDLLFDYGPASCAIGLLNGFGSLGKLVSVDRLVAIFDERLNIVLYLLKCLRILFGEPLREILRERGGW